MPPQIAKLRFHSETPRCPQSRVSIKLFSPPPGKSVTIEDVLLILYSFSSFWALFQGRGKTRFCGQKFTDICTFLTHVSNKFVWPNYEKLFVGSRIHIKLKIVNPDFPTANGNAQTTIGGPHPGKGVQMDQNPATKTNSRGQNHEAMKLAGGQYAAFFLNPPSCILLEILGTAE